ncbi:PGAP1-like protein-domain-containing protein [Phycomyces nitens]|nr:PGAP1-like protein-domain-containing protein [Phycomyces nitens]
MSCLSKTQWLLCILMGLSALAIHVILDAFYHPHDTPGCSMSYARPSYHPIPNVVSRLSEKYTLYLYREVNLDREDLSGVPVLFIPGHAGSYKQVRSIAAQVANHYYYEIPLHEGSASMDIFTVDLNEEFSAMSGQLLQDQAEYLNSAVSRILEYYPSASSVMVLAHSMGGIVARTMFMLPNYQQGSINTIITLATPHIAAPLVLDPSLDRLYRSMDTFWQQGYANGTLNDVSVISLAGGSLDTTVNSDSASVSGWVPESHGLTVFTTAVPEVWTGCDHRAILWCNQLVKVVAAMMVEIVDQRKPQQTIPVDQRMAVFRRHLGLKAQSHPWVHTSSLRNFIFQDSVSQRGPIKRQGTKIVVQPNSTFALVTNASPDNFGIFIWLCNKDNGCVDITEDVKPMPSALDSTLWWSLELQPNILQNYDEIVLVQRQPISHQDFFLDASFVAPIKTLNTSLSDIARSGLKFDLEPSIVSQVHIPVIHNPLLIYRLNLSSECSERIVRQRMGTEGETKFNHGTLIHLTFHHHKDEGLVLEFWGTQNCGSSEALLEIDWYGSAAQWLLRYGAASITTFWLVITLSVISYQLEHQTSEGSFIPFEEALLQCLKGRLVILAGILALCGYRSLWAPWINRILPFPMSPLSFLWDELLLGDQGDFFWWMPVGLFVLAIGLTGLVWGILSLGVVLLSYAYKTLGSSTPTSQPSTTVLWVSAMLAILGQGVIPTCVAFSLFYIARIAVAVYTRAGALKENTDYSWQAYYYQQTIVLFLTSMMPFYGPGTAVYIRDLFVGWIEFPSMADWLSNLPICWLLVFITIAGQDTKHFEHRYPFMPRLLHTYILLKALYGIKTPFLLQTILS